MKISACYAADFETTTDINDCRVWAWSICNVDDPSKFDYGNSIDSFINWCKEKENRTLYFFNLRFDCESILSYLGTHGYTFIEDKKERADCTYTILISDMGAVYSMEIYFEVGKHRVNKVTLYDAAKIFPNQSVASLAVTFGLPLSKLKIDYDEYREVGHEITPHEVAYIRADVEIVARALKQMFEQELTKSTIASDALHFYKTTIKGFRKIFPELDKDADNLVRSAYRGGFTYVNPKHKNKICGAGVSIDVNSLYPSVLRYELLPYGYGHYFLGKYEDDPLYPLYVQTIKCKFKIKHDKIPTIQIKNSLSFIPNEYLETSNDEVVTLTLTNVDLKLFLEHYNTEELQYIEGMKFKGMRGNFDTYVDHWTDIKIKAGKEGNKGLRAIAKLCLNSLYGKFGLSSRADRKVPVVDEEGKVTYHLLPAPERKTIYIPIATWVTSYGRERIIRTCQAIREWSEKNLGYDAWVYSDTDSAKILVTEEQLYQMRDEGIVALDDYKLGYFAFEESFQHIKAIRQKCYICEEDGRFYPTVSGLPKKLAPILNLENFKRGFTTKGLTVEQLKEMARNNGATEEEIEEIKHKTTYKHVAGGIVMVDIDFTIK